MLYLLLLPWHFVMHFLTALCFGWLLRPSITPACPWGSLAVALAGPVHCPVTVLSSQPRPWQRSGVLTLWPAEGMSSQEMLGGNALQSLQCPSCTCPDCWGSHSRLCHQHPLAKAPGWAVSPGQGCPQGRAVPSSSSRALRVPGSQRSPRLARARGSSRSPAVQVNLS